MLGVAWVQYVCAHVISHLSKCLPIFNALVLKIEDQLVSFFVFSFSTEEFFISLRMANLEFLVGADYCVADFDFLECVHIQHAKLKDTVFGQSLSGSCL